MFFAAIADLETIRQPEYGRWQFVDTHLDAIQMYASNAPVEVKRVNSHAVLFLSFQHHHNDRPSHQAIVAQHAQTAPLNLDFGSSPFHQDKELHRHVLEKYK